MYYSYEDYKTAMNAKFSVSGKYGAFSGSLSGEYQQSSEFVFRSNTTITRTYVLLEEAQVSINAGDIAFDPYFAKYITNYLPIASSITKDDAFHFFSVFGDVVPVQANLAGLCEEYSYTSDVYVEETDANSVKVQASAKFFIDAEADYSQQSSITQEWEESTNIMVVNINGGQWDGDPSHFSQWVQSVSESYLNLQPVSSMLLTPITDVFQFPYSEDANIQAKGKVLEKFLAMWLSRPGCMDPAAPNYNCSATVDDGSCEPHVIVYTGNSCQDCPNGILKTNEGYLKCALTSNEALINGTLICGIFWNQNLHQCRLNDKSFQYTVSMPSLAACFPMPLF
jgi:hypothetical protein